MRKILRYLGSLSMILIVLFNVSCDILTPIDPELKTEKEAWDVIIEAHAMKQLWFHNFFRIYSNNYSRGQLFTYEPTKAQLDFLIQEYNELMTYTAAVEAAVDTIDAMANDLSKTPLTKSTAKAGLLSALKDFFSAGSEVNENNRKRIIMIASNMSQADRDQLYDELVIGKWQRDIGTSSEFWTKLQNGDLDDKASTLYKNFYDGANSVLNPFTGLANDKNLTPGKMLAKDGMNLCNKGMDVVLETGKTIVPGLGQATDILDAGKDYYEKAEKMVDKPMEFLSDEIKSRGAAYVAGIIDIDSKLDSEGAGKYVKTIAELTLGSDDPQELIEKGIDAGIAMISSPDKSIETDIAIAQKTQPADGLPEFIIGIGTYAQNAGEFILNLPSGNWDITSKNNTGQSSSPVSTPIISQQVKTVNVTANNDAESAYLDSLTAILETMTYMNIYLDFGDKSIYISSAIIGSLRFPLSWSGKSFGQSFSHTVLPDETGGTLISGTKYDCSIDGNLTLVSFDRAGISLTANKTIEEPNASNDPTLQAKYIHEITISGLPFAYFAGGSGVGFDVDSYSNREYQASLSSIASFSYREIYYEYSSEEGAMVVSSDTSYSEITTSDPRLRVYFYK